MMKFSSKEEWKSYCFGNHKVYLKNKYFRRWLKQKKVDIFDCSGLKKEEITMVKKAIAKSLKLCGRRFKIGPVRRINLDFAIKGGKIGGAKILNMVKKSRKKDKSCSAAIFLANKKAKSGKDVLKFGDALTYVSDGVIIFTFDPSVNYPKKFFKAEVAHEIYHLLGLNAHHEDTEVKGYKNLDSCNMEYNAPSETLCQKCRDGLLSFWEGIRHATKN